MRIVDMLVRMTHAIMPVRVLVPLRDVQCWPEETKQGSWDFWRCAFRTFSAS